MAGASDGGLALTVLVSAATGFASGLIAWAGATFFGKPLARFYDLRLQAHTLFFEYANLLAETEKERAAVAHTAFRKVAAELDALRAILPRLVLAFLKWRGYSIADATKGLVGFSNSLWTKGRHRVWHRVTAQRGLRLPIEEADLEALKQESSQRLDTLPPDC